MNEQMNITTFHELLNSEVDKGSLFDLLRGLTEVQEPSSIRRIGFFRQFRPGILVRTFIYFVFVHGHQVYPILSYRCNLISISSSAAFLNCSIALSFSLLDS